MKKTLYQILGVGPKASAEDIAAAYEERTQELIFATIHDPNKALVLQQAKEILLDPKQRVNYDASIAALSRPAARPVIEQEPASGFLNSVGKWIVPVLVLVAAIVWWTRRDPPPPAPPIATQAEAPPAPAPEVSQPGEPSAPKAAKESSEPAPMADSREEPATESGLGQWSCMDPISGRSERYDFQPDASLVIESADGPRSFKYDKTGSVLTLTDPKQSRLFKIEESTSRKMILNTGAEGRRLVCTR
ncbi:MAG: hypothetical protein ABL878_04905 [Burkholderiales bacterium]